MIESWGWKPGADEFGPDVMVYATTHEQARYTGSPELIVEVLSSDRARDMIRKARKYAAAGLERYWVVDPGEPDEATADDLPELIVYRAVDGVLVEQSRHRPGTTASLEIAPDATVDIDPAILLS